MTQLTEEEAVAYLDDRKTKGFNAVEIRVIGRKFQTNAPNNFYNEPPFTNGLKDWSVRNEAYWTRIDFLLKADALTVAWWLSCFLHILAPPAATRAGARKR